MVLGTAGDQKVMDLRLSDQGDIYVLGEAFVEASGHVPFVSRILPNRLMGWTRLVGVNNSDEGQSLHWQEGIITIVTRHAIEIPLGLTNGSKVEKRVEVNLVRFTTEESCYGVSYGESFECPAGHYCPSGIQNALDG
eukprot:598770-Hanusia_phi.AAC.1